MEQELFLEKKKQLELEATKEKQESLAEENLTSEAAEMTDSKETIAAKQRVFDVMTGFLQDFNDKWEEKKVRVVNDYGITMAKYSFSDYVEITKDKKHSGSAIALRNGLKEMKELSSDEEHMPPEEDFVEKLLTLSMASANYADSHRGSKWTNAGAGRQAIAIKLQKQISEALKKMLSKEQEEKIQFNADADFEVGESLSTITKDLRRASVHFSNFSEQIGLDSQAYTPAEQLERRMQALRVNERKIKIYRQHHPKKEDREPLINELIEAYEEGCRLEMVRSLVKTDKQEETSLTDVIETHLEEEGEVAKKEKLSPKELDQELGQDQLKGIEEIDNWLIRNCRNGGAAGIAGVRNTHEDFVSAVLSLSKRERLHMYYLVETGKRKEPSVVDVGMSQSLYVPSLSAFKGQMLATRWKFWARVTGGYTYMHKLSEAFQLTKEYREEIKSVTELEKERKQMKDSGSDPAKKDQQPDDAAQLRLQKLNALRDATSEYYKNIEAAKKASGKKKAAEEERCREAAGYCEKLLKELVMADSALEKQEVANRTPESENAVIESGSSMYGTVVGVPSMAQGGVNAASEYLFRSSWHLESAGWAEMNLWAGSLSAAADGVANITGIFTTVLTLMKTKGQLSDTEVSEKVLGILQNGVKVTKDAFTIKELSEAAGSFAVEASSTAGTIIGAAGTAVSAGIAISKSIGAKKMKYHGAKAKDFFEEKRKRLQGDQTKEKELSLQKKRELKYEQNMMKLQEDLAKRQKKTAAYAWISTGISAASILIPGLGIVSAGFSVVSSILDSKEVSGIKTRLFDNFFHMDDLAEKVMKNPEIAKRLSLPDSNTAGKEVFLESFRKRVAACAGFCDMDAAADQICLKFAKLIRGKLFGNTAEDEKERDGYIEFVKSLNLKYNEKKQYPKENILMRKLTAM